MKQVSFLHLKRKIPLFQVLSRKHSWPFFATNQLQHTKKLQEAFPVSSHANPLFSAPLSPPLCPRHPTPTNKQLCDDVPTNIQWFRIVGLAAYLPTDPPASLPTY